MEKIKKRFARIYLVVWIFFLLCGASSCISSIEKYHYDFLKEDVAKSTLPDSLKAKIAQMSFNKFLNKFLKQNPIKKEIAKENAKCVKEQQLGDSIWEELKRCKETELETIRKQYIGKTKILRIKRLWLNGDVLPWTYNSWQSILYHFKGSYHDRGKHSGSVAGTTTPNIFGSAKYVGDNKLDYINIVFSDNSYKRFLIKDNPEWLLVKEGEKVELRYVDTGYKVGTDVGRVLEKDAFDLVISIKYVPLFK